LSLNSKIFRNDKLPNVEVRYVETINNCDRKHAHNEITITAICEGEMDIVFNNKTDKLVPDSLSVVCPNEAHYAKVIDNKSRKCYVLYLDISWCIELQKSLFMDVSNFLPLNSSLINDKQLYDSYILLCETLFSKDSYIKKEEEIIMFFSKIFTKYCNNKSNINNSLPIYSDIIYKIQKYLDENFLRDISLDDMAQTTQLTSFHVLRLFKKNFGLTPHAYILNKKIHKAKELLKTDMLLIDIAIECGFFDQSHFNKSFKKVFQITPKEYRKNLFC
jgi:AraC-like DNA-binding protein